VGVSFEKSTIEFYKGYNTPAQSSFLDTTKAQPLTGAIKTLGEAAPQEFHGYGAVMKSAIDICGLFKRDPHGLTYIFLKSLSLDKIERFENASVVLIKSPYRSFFNSSSR